MLTHSTIEAVSALRRQLSLSGPDVAAIDVHVPSGHLAVCNISAPRTGLESKFSLRHTAALAACGEPTAAIQTYSDKNAVASILTAVRDRVTVHGDRPPGMDAHVVITTRAGTVAEASRDAGIPDADLARQSERLTAKFDSLAIAVVGAERADKLRHAIATLEELPNIAGLMAV